jgi:hypothetical protein
VTRAASRYGRLLDPSGMRADGFVAYGFRDSLAGFHTFTRVG